MKMWDKLKPYLQSPWTYIATAFLVLFSLFEYEKSSNNKLEASLITSDEQKDVAVLKTKEGDIETQVKKIENAPPAPPLTPDETETFLNNL